MNIPFILSSQKIENHLESTRKSFSPCGIWSKKETVTVCHIFNQALASRSTMTRCTYPSIGMCSSTFNGFIYSSTPWIPFPRTPQSLPTSEKNFLFCCSSPLLDDVVLFHYWTVLHGSYLIWCAYFTAFFWARNWPISSSRSGDIHCFLLGSTFYHFAHISSTPARNSTNPGPFESHTQGLPLII